MLASRKGDMTTELLSSGLAGGKRVIFRDIPMTRREGDVLG